MSTTIIQSLTLITFTVSEKKIAMLKFCPHADNWLARRPNTDHYID